MNRRFDKMTRGFALGVSLWMTGGAAGAQEAEKAPGEAAPGQSSGSLVPARPGGLTAETVGKRAMATSYSAKAAQENLRSAAAKVDQTIAQFLPKLTGTARYSRLSQFTPPPLFEGPSVNFLATSQPEGAPFDPTRTFPVAFGTGSFPVLVDQYLLQASMVVPISDYVLRMKDAYLGSSYAEEALKHELVAAKTKSYTEGKILYYTWLRAQGAVLVTRQALEDQKLHLKDAQSALVAGHASRADVLRGETGVSSATLAVERAKNLAELVERQIRIAMHAPEEETVAPGESLESQLDPQAGTLSSLEQEALKARPEIRALETSVAAMRKQQSATRSGYYPQVLGVGNLVYSNPNQRRVPQKQEWFPTWDVSAQLTWSPNDAYITGPLVTEVDSKIMQLESQAGTIRDGMRLEVTQAWQAIREADASIDTAKRQLESAREAVRVSRELFAAGRATSTTLTDAETELTRARLDMLNGLVDARVARVKLDHALGRDVARVR